MDAPITSNQPASPDFMRIARATRFAFACVVLGVSWLAIKSCLNIPRFARIFMDMLGENEPLPKLTRLVIATWWPLLALSLSVPAAAIVLLFTRDVVRSLYCLGVLVLISIVVSVVVTHATYSPLMTIIEKMQTAQ